MSEPQDVDAFLRRAAASPAPTGQPPVQLSDPDFSRALLIARSTSLEGQLLASVELGTVELTPFQWELLATRHREAMIHALRTERQLLAASRVLRGVGIRHCGLKGVALAHSVYPEPATRTFNDADLLIEPTRFGDAVEVLTACGWQRSLPEIAPGFDDRFAKDVPLVRNGVALDLHRTLIEGPYGARIDVERMIGQARHIRVGSRPLAILCVSDLYVHAALTAGAADVPPRLVTLTDMLMLERSPEFDAGQVVYRTEQSKIGPAVARGIRVLQEILRLEARPALLGWANGWESTWDERLILKTYLRRGGGYKRALASIPYQRNWKDRRDLARALILPSREYRVARSWSVRGHAARAVRSLLR